MCSEHRGSNTYHNANTSTHKMYTYVSIIHVYYTYNIIYISFNKKKEKKHKDLVIAAEDLEATVS